ncbi:MAG: cation diffusion facilitator family transporter [Prevotella sp.]
MESTSRERRIYKVTLMGSAVNMVLLLLKFVAGIVGSSAAMIADAVHSLSDFITDVVVIAFVRISNKPQDKNHDYGHGKYETLATTVIALALLGVGVLIFYNSAVAMARAYAGEPLPVPGKIALAAALLSIGLKEWAYRFTERTGREVDSNAVIANAWHHRSDALSSIGTALGIGGAIVLGEKWAVLDPIAALVVSVFIVRTALLLMRQSVGELLDRSLPDDVEQEIVDIATREPQVSGVHHLCTRRMGNRYAIEMHVRMPGDITLYEAHLHASRVESMLRERFGEHTHLNVHVEPVKIDGKYKAPERQNGNSNINRS